VTSGSSTTPVRTCVGCRERAAKVELLRVVAVAGALIPDPAGRLPGRGASLHPRPECLQAAVRRRAFARALRVNGPVDFSALADFVSGNSSPANRVGEQVATT
jgi:predicted RNA-binding protein YlxR (DUF448 family)